jgi:hypothetical protein
MGEVSLKKLLVEITEPLASALDVYKDTTGVSKRHAVETALRNLMSREGIHIEEPKTWLTEDRRAQRSSD